MSSRRILVSLVLAGFSCGAHAAEAPLDPAVLGREVRQTSVFPNAWIYTEVGGVEVLSTTSFSGTVHVLGDLAVRARAIGAFWPAQTGGVKPNIVMLGNSKEYTSISPRGGVRSAGNLSINGGPAGSPRLLLNLGLEVPAGGASVMNGVDTLMGNFGVAVLKYQRLGGRPPPWLDQGLSKLLKDMDVTYTKLSLPSLKDDPTLAVRKTGSEVELKKALTAGTFFPLDRLFTATNLRASTAATNEAYEFIHLCLFGQPEKYRKPFLDLVAAQASGSPMNEEAFKSAFGTDYIGMLLELWKYNAPAKSSSYKLAGADGKLLPDPPKTETRKATDEELGRIVAPWRSGGR